MTTPGRHVLITCCTVELDALVNCSAYCSYFWKSKLVLVCCRSISVEYAAWNRQQRYVFARWLVHFAKMSITVATTSQVILAQGTLMCCAYATFTIVQAGISVNLEY